MLAALACLVAASPAAAAQAAPGLNAPGQNTRVSYKATLDVSMRVNVSTTFESIQKCVPGENGSVSYTFDYESARGGGGKPKAVQMELLNGVGGSIKPSVGAKNAAVERGTVGDWKISLDRCLPDSPAIQPPNIERPDCKTIKGRTAVTLSTDSDLGDDELASTSFDGGIIVNRLGGEKQNISCLRLFQETKSVKELFEFSVSTPAYAIGLEANSNLFTGSNMGFAIKIKNLDRVLLNAAAKKGSGTANFKVGGPCYAMTSSAKGNRKALGPVAERLDSNVGPTFGSPRFEKCVVEGDGTVIVRRTTKVKRFKF